MREVTMIAPEISRQRFLIEAYYGDEITPESLRHFLRPLPSSSIWPSHKNLHISESSLVEQAQNPGLRKKSTDTARVGNFLITIIIPPMSGDTDGCSDDGVCCPSWDGDENGAAGRSDMARHESAEGIRFAHAHLERGDQRVRWIWAPGKQKRM